MTCEKKQCRFVFFGVFVLGILGVTITARYYLRLEPVADREARNQRIAAEVQRFTK
ncbi:MAG: hypothetical protein H7301_05680 [Cryobacterium sp.]|nr:hypothetical protein [Oligoflexia bacterium]